MSIATSRWPRPLRGVLRRKLTARVVAAACLLTAPAICQQTYVTRYTAYFGYAHLNSPSIKLPEHGVQLQIGVRPTTWYTLGFDYTNARGDLTLAQNQVLTSLQQSLGAQISQLIALGRLPAGYSLVVPAHSSTQTFAAGPELAFRHWAPITLMLRPSIGLIREVAVPKPGDAFATAVVKQLAASGKKVDWAPFYGVGGGIDFNLSRHFALRVQGDLVYDHLFNDLLQKGRGTVRVGIGPVFNLGKNIVKQ